MPPFLPELLIGLALKGAGLIVCGFLGWCLVFDDDREGFGRDA